MTRRTRTSPLYSPRRDSLSRELPRRGYSRQSPIDDHDGLPSNNRFERPAPDTLEPRLTSSPLSRKGGDSLSRRSMSRTEEDIESGVDISIMGNATLSTYPPSYSEVCDTFRPRLACAKRTDSGRERFIHFLIPSPVRRRFIAEHVSEGRPACIKNRLRQAGPGESGGVHIADRDVIELPNDAGREFMVKVTASVDDARVQVSRAKIKAARPTLIPFERMLLSLVAEIPNEIARARLSVEQSSQRFDAVSIDQQHRRMLMPFRVLEKTLKLAETSTFTPLMFNSKSSARAYGRAAYGRPVISTASGGEVSVSALMFLCKAAVDPILGNGTCSPA